MQVDHKYSYRNCAIHDSNGTIQVDLVIGQYEPLTESPSQNRRNRATRAEIDESHYSGNLKVDRV